MPEIIKRSGELIYNLVIYNFTGYEKIDKFILYSGIVLIYVFAVGIIMMIALNSKLRSRKRTEDKLMFIECMLVLALTVEETIVIGAVFFNNPWFGHYVWLLFNVINDLLYMITIFLWVLLVDYILYRRKEHLWRDYWYSLIPFVLYFCIVIIQWLLIHGPIKISYEDYLNIDIIIQIAKKALELFYIVKAIMLVRAYNKEFREPRFLQLNAFIIPFLLGCIFRSYDSVFLAMGILLTNITMIKRDTYLDYDTGFYNRSYLEFISSYRDQKKYDGGSAILICAEGRGKSVSNLIKALKPIDSNAFILDKDIFLIFSESIRESAVKMAIDIFTEAAQTSEEPFTPNIKSLERDMEESAVEFATRLLRTAGDMNGSAHRGVAL